MLLAFVFTLSYNLSVSISIGLGLVITIFTLVKGYLETPHMNEDMVECMGGYIGRPLKPGPHFLFPFFSLEILASRVFLGEQKLELYLDEKNLNGGDIELQDCSTSMKSFFFFQITDSYKATYHIDDVIAAVEEKADHVLRAFFGPYTLDESIQLKSFFKIENVACHIDVSKDSPYKHKKVEELRTYVASKEEVDASQFYKTLRSWGVEPRSFSITDIDVPQNIKDQRSRILTAEKDRQVAEIEIKTAQSRKQITVVDAEAQKEKAALEGKGEADKVKALMEGASLSGQEVAGFLIQSKKWDAIAKGANVTIIEGGDNETATGVKLGVGIGVATKKNEVEPKKGNKS
jgi:regulator of protease activity HflC (stomatin/prohibitin superfamily)